MKFIRERLTPKQYLFNFLLICTALFAVYLLVAWSTYSAWDNSWATSSSLPQIYNKSGSLGAWWIDLLFVCFGYVSNFVPFSLLFLSLYFLFRQKRGGFSVGRLLIACVGLIFCVSGVCVWSTMLFAHNPHYPAGGVVGAVLVQSFFPVLDFVGLMLISVLATVAGFLLFTGVAFIHFVMDCFYWLTMKTKPEATSEVVAMPSQQEELSLNEETSEAAEATELQEGKFVDIEKFINIRGVAETSEEVATTEADIISITEQTESMEKTESAVEISPVFSSPLRSAEEISYNAHNVSNLVLPKEEWEAIPSVSLPDEVLTAQSIVEQEMPQESTALFDVVEQNKESAVEVEENFAPQPIYKPYGQTLIHPALQPKATLTEKPTTPLPSLDLLEYRPAQAHRITREETQETSERIEKQLRNFKVEAKVKAVLVGPVVTRYELELQPGVKATRVTSIDTDLARALMFRSIRVAEVIPGKPYIGIETPNAQRQMVSLREVLDSEAFRQSKALLPMALGKDISGQPVVVDLAKMPHLLVAGSTGSGKSVGINTMILSLLFRVKPEDVKFIMIDPKVVELSIYDDIPHLLTNVVTDMKKAANALRWCVDEMERRYQLLSALRVRNIEGYNEKITEYDALNMPIPDPLWRPGDTMDTLPPPLEKLNYIVVIVDEFADLMMVAGKQVEELIARLAQKARAIGIHLILATQRPSVDVITGLIKANVPSRIAFTVASKIDSRTILDQAGAETLLGRGDMLYSPQGSTELMRVHGAFMSDDEVARVVDDWKARGKPQYIEGILEGNEDTDSDETTLTSSEDLDDLFDEVVDFVINTGNTSTSYIQRKFKVGFNRAARIMDQLEEQGIIVVHNGKREVVARNGSDY